MLTGKCFGKARVDGGERRLLELSHHCMDVAAVTEAILQLPTWRARMRQAAGRELDAVDLARLCVLAFLHDVGKASAGFQAKIRDDGQDWGRLRRDESGHTREALPLFYNREVRIRASTRLNMDEILSWSSDSSDECDLWLAAISHHGDPIIPARISQRWLNLGHLWELQLGYDPCAALEDLGHAARTAFPEAFQPNHAPLPDSASLVHAFAGLVSLADWIASNSDPDFFPYDHGDGERSIFSRTRAAFVLKAMRVDVEDARADLRVRAPTFQSVFPFTARPIQDLMAREDLGPIVVVEAETGSGKTEAALWRFRTLFAAGEVDALAFVLPTRVAAVSLESRVREAMVGLFPDDRLRPNVVLAAPGYLRVDGHEGRRDLLARFDTLWPDWPEEQDAHRHWAAENAKRYLAAGVAVGTIDQVLFSGLKIRHAHLRGAALMRSLLVVDEVHASDAYMTSLLKSVLHRQVSLGGHALLLSATLGGAARTNLLSAGREKPRRGRSGLEGAPAHGAAPYPAVSDHQGMTAVGGGDRRKVVHVRLAEKVDDPTAVASMAIDAARRGARVLVVRNTVTGAVAVQRALEAQSGSASPLLFKVASMACPHHGRYAAEDRRLMDAAVDIQFGKAAPRGAGLILVGTQTLESSLDIDADLLITDLAPLDVLLQRIGRLHRHERPRPPGFEDVTVIVLAPAHENLAPFLSRKPGRRHGVGSVYENVVSIEATWRELKMRPSLSVPADCRALVEAATNPATLAELAASLGGPWPAAFHDSVGKYLANQTAADAHSLHWSVEWGELLWPDPNERVTTRLGDDDRLFEWEEGWVSPFGNTVHRLKAPAWMTKGAEPDLAPSPVTTLDGATSWRAGGLSFRYDRFGLALDG